MKYVRFREAVLRVGIPPELASLLVEHEVVCPRPTLDDEPVISSEEAEDLRVARTLIEELGVNLEGVEIILRMRRRQLLLQESFDLALREVRDEVRRRLRDPSLLGPAGYLPGPD